ncbi:MAG TPA: hypothetical protein VIJ52_01430 [Pseudolabrys sp.]
MRLTPRSADFTPGAPIETDHALVPVEPVITATDAPEAFRQAPFLTQLLAIRDQHPQTRLYCRAEPRVALAAYRNTATLTEH